VGSEEQGWRALGNAGTRGAPIDLTTVLVRADGSLERRTRVSVVLVGDGAPLVLRGTGVAIWDAFAVARSVADAISLLAEVYDTSPDRVAREAFPVLEALRDAGALSVTASHGS
jgi:hypothetical protein